VQDLVNHLSADLFGVDGAGSLLLFAPEIVLCATILLILAIRVFNWGQKIDPFWPALIGVGYALWRALPPEGFATTSGITQQEMFTGLLIYDSLTVYLRCILLFVAVLFIVLTKLTGLATSDEGPDFFCLVLGATLGFCVMASANHLLAVFLGVEMASVPSYVMAGILKGNARSSEASLKYAVYGAGAAGVMLYGISLIVGVLGSAHLPTLAGQLAAMDFASGDQAGAVMALALGGLMIMVGLAFKLSAVPFHFWCPDVFEGAPAEIGAFLSVASKAAALALLVRVAVGFGYVNPADQQVAAKSVGASSSNPVVALAAYQQHEGTDDGTTDESAKNIQAADDRAGESSSGLSAVRGYIAMLLAFVAAITCTFGNLAAYGQSNIKRMLAYSTIAHAGYMIMPVAAAIALIGTNTALAQDAIAALLFYIAVYLFMNLGAFSIVALLRDRLGSEQIADYAGLVRTAPFTVVCFSVILFSLVGIPPCVGFLGKAWIFLALIKAGGPVMIALLVIAGVNTAISLVYYLRVARVMTVDPPPDQMVVSQGLAFLPATYMTFVTAPVLILFFWSDGIYTWARVAASQLFL